MTAIAAIGAAGAMVVASLRWLRVAQREHYLPGSIANLYRLWMSTSNANGVLAVVPAIAFAIAATGTVALPMTWLGIGAVAAFPLGLPIRGRTSPLAWTARLQRLAAIVGIVGVLVAMFGAAILADVDQNSALRGTLLALVLLPMILEASLLISRPLERRLSQRFVDEAATILARIRPTVVGITGSYGKTSTKGYVRALVEGTKRVVPSPASFNNRMGLARAVNEHLTGDAEVFVAEMGTYGRGEIADLCAWIPPDIAVLTSIGPVHLERFKSEANIVAAKAEILVSAKVAVFNVDHPALNDLADKTVHATVWRCGTGDAARDVRVIAGTDRHDIYVRGRNVGSVRSQDVFAANLACAVAVALELGVGESEIVARASTIVSPAHRQTMSMSDAGFTIIDDTFNANPAGAARALGVLAANGDAHARRVLVTPGMVELGPRQVAENIDFARAASAIVDDIVIVGRTNRSALEEGTKSGGASVIVVATRHDAVEWVRAHLEAGDVVLYENDLPDHYP